MSAPPERLPARIPPTGRLREIGLANWAFCKLAARVTHIPRVNLFTTLGVNKPLLWSWLPFGGYLLYAGKLPRRDAELVILRVGHLRDCAYELQQHRRLARDRGVDDELQARIFEGPDALGLTDRQRILITATDEIVVTRSVSEETWAALTGLLSPPQLVEFTILATQYDALATTLSTLRIPLDYPE